MHYLFIVTLRQSFHADQLQEALLENDLSVSSVILTELSHYKDCVEDDSVPTSLSSIASTTSSSCNGEKHDGQSFIITDTLSGKCGGQLQANSMIEFSLWLDRVEKQLDSVCHCSLLGKQTTVNKDVVANAEVSLIGSISFFYSPLE